MLTFVIDMMRQYGLESCVIVMQQYKRILCVIFDFKGNPAAVRNGFQKLHVDNN